MTTAREYIKQLRAFSSDELAEEAYYLAAAFVEPPQHDDVDALTREGRMVLVSGEQARRQRDPDAVDPGPDEWTVPRT